MFFLRLAISPIRGRVPGFYCAARAPFGLNAMDVAGPGARNAGQGMGIR